MGTVVCCTVLEVQGPPPEDEDPDVDRTECCVVQKSVLRADSDASSGRTRLP
jgi:hypothetical protein